MKSRLFLGSFGVLALLCVGLAQTGPGHSVLRDVGLYEVPASYTELTFSSSGELPSALTKSGTSVKVSFGIHNVSDTPHSYDWTITLVHSGVSEVKASGTAPTPAQGRAAVTRSVAASCDSGQLEVVVRLASPAESISFWMTCPATPTAGKMRDAQ